jgi:hypothetical protein
MTSPARAVVGAVVIIGCAVGLFRYGPEAMEGTSGACSATYARIVARSSGINQSMQELRGSRRMSPTQQRAIEDTMRNAIEVGGMTLSLRATSLHPSIDPDITCAVWYWRARFSL